MFNSYVCNKLPEGNMIVQRLWEWFTYELNCFFPSTISGLPFVIFNQVFVQHVGRSGVQNPIHISMDPLN
jgi:hypothetical protein